MAPAQGVRIHVFVSQYLNNTVFAHFPNASECGLQSAVVALNPSQVDFAPPITIVGAALYNIDVNALLQLGRTNSTAVECLDACDSYDHALVIDVDGSFTGTTYTMLFMRVARYCAGSLSTFGCVVSGGGFR